MQKKYPIDESSVILQKTTYTFDVSVWELVWWSFIGAKVCMLEPEGEKDPLVIIETIKRYGVTTMHFVPSMLSIFLHYLENYQDIKALSSLKQVFASGEALNLQQVERFNRLLNAPNSTELYNLYGPTEAAIDVTSFDCSPKVELNTVPIGRPIDNINLYILDKHLNLLPIGIPGELFIGGVGVARGYINKPELTEEKFIPNPFVPGEKLYRTGDLVRWYSEGDIEYLGRLDHQIKIRGFRIELGEIENKLLLHPDIKDAVVVGIEDKDRKYLCVYYVSSKEISSRELRRILSVYLPEYMIPSIFVRMDTLPLSSNGKIDIKALPQQCMNESKVDYAPPRNSIDQDFVEIFEDVLDIEKIGIDDSLFDLGGDSLTVMMIFSRIYDCNWGITAADFYLYPTIRELSDKINGELKLNALMRPMDILEIGRQEVAAVREMLTFGNILLTGATGFLGSHILNELLKTTDSNIYCLVHGESDSLAENRLRQTISFYFGDKYDNYFGERIIVVSGDVTKENLGLKEKEYERLGKQIDTIIHSAVMVKYSGDYSLIEKVNVFGTKVMIDFAQKYNCKLNHFSTILDTEKYDKNFDNKRVALDFSEINYAIGHCFENLFTKSKFEAEKLVLNASKKGLEATIFRMGNLIGRHINGYFQQDEDENSLFSTIRSMMVPGAPVEDLYKKEIEFSPVELSARTVVEILETQEVTNKIFHIYNDKKIKMRDLKGILQNINSTQT